MNRIATPVVPRLRGSFIGSVPKSSCGSAAWVPALPATSRSGAGGLEGIAAAHVNSATQTVHVAYDPSRVKVIDLVRAIRTAGYSAGTASMRVLIRNMHCSSCDHRAPLQPPPFISPRVPPPTPKHQPLPRARSPPFPPHLGFCTHKPTPPSRCKFWFAAAISVPVMLLSYPDLVPGLARLDADGQRHAPHRLGAARRAEPAGAGLVGLAVLHRHVGRAQAPRGQHAHADRDRHHGGLPLFGSGGRLARALSRSWSWPRCSGTSPTVVVALVVLGLALEIKAKGRTSQAIKKLIGLQAKTARVVP